MQNTDTTWAKPGKAIVYIPARGKSSRLPGKALADLGGHPLISYTIRIAKALRGVDHVFVDTDCAEIGEAARAYGAEVPFLREECLAQDKTLLTETANAFLERIQRHIGFVARRVTLMPTSPFRHLATVQRLYDDLDTHLSVVTVLKADVDVEKSFFVREDDRHSLDELLCYPIQQFEWIKGIGYFQGIYAAEAIPRKIWLYNNFKYHVLKNPIELVDIDYPEDLETARRIVSDNMYDFGMQLC